MAEDLNANLANYKLQFQQVEAALTTDPNNEDLLKLKNDLQEVIDLTLDLIVNQKAVEAGTSTTTDDAIQTSTQTHSWKVGDHCVALYSEDGQYYEATVDEILDDGSCTVTFDSYGNSELTQISLLKKRDQGTKREAEKDGEGSGGKMKKKDKQAAEREYKKKKNEKKRQRLKALEEERETEKNKWLDFNAKTFSKTSKGRVKKSIFATPDSTSGKVGVGTCGVGGRQMTQFQQQQKWLKK